MVTAAYEERILHAAELIQMIFDVSAKLAWAHAASRKRDSRSIHPKKHAGALQRADP